MDPASRLPRSATQNGRWAGGHFRDQPRKDGTAGTSWSCQTVPTKPGGHVSSRARQPAGSQRPGTGVRATGHAWRRRMGCGAGEAKRERPAGQTPSDRRVTGPEPWAMGLGRCPQELKPPGGS